jgi:hypothetical protein
MVLTMAFKATGTTYSSTVLKAYFSCVVWKNNGLIKVDEMGCLGNSVGIMTNAARGSLLNYMSSVFRKALVGQNIVAIMTFITEGISLWTLRS